jgi:competence protein ComEA
VPHAGGSGPLPPCPQPRELAAQDGHTRRISCEPGVEGLPVRGPARVLFGLGIDPNRADASTLEALPGIGPARAAAIVAGRENGAYRSPADLGRVRGIGPVTLRRITSWLAFGDTEQVPGGPGSLPP